MKKPFFSIVIANFNHGQFLETAIESLLSQSCSDFELIVVDAGSTDNSVEIIKKYEARLTWWCSEKDKGQSDAFNKGFAHASGRFGCWLNADDFMFPSALEAVKRYAERHPDVAWIGGNTLFFNVDSKIEWCSKGCTFPGIFGKTSVGGPSSFFLIEDLKRLGGFDLNLHYRMDTDLWFKMCCSGIVLHRVNHYVWGFRVHESSKTSSAFSNVRSPEMLEESLLLQKRYHYTKKDMVRAHAMARWIKLFSGIYLKAWIDTKRFRGCDVRNMKGKYEPVFVDDGFN